jgi:hypothetical protein
VPALVFHTNTTFTTASTYINYATTPATTPLRGSTMPVARDARGRFASSHEKTPVTTVEEAADTIRHFTTIMNEVARNNSLCSQFGVSVTRAVGDVPGVKFDTPNVPEFSLSYSIQGTVLTPAGAKIPGPNRDSRAQLAAAFLRDEFRAWAAEHDLDPMRGGTWLAWVDTLPDDRKRPGSRTNTLGETGTSTYAEYTQAAERIVTFALASDPVPPPPPTLASADPVIRPFQVGDRVIRVSEAHTVSGRTTDFVRESDRGMTAVVSRVDYGDDADVQVVWDNPKGTATSRIDGACLRHLLPAPAGGDKPAEDAPTPERPEEQVFHEGDRVLVLPSSAQYRSETDRRYSAAFTRPRDGDLIAEVDGLAGDGHGYRVRAVDGYGGRQTLQTVATVDLRPAPADRWQAPAPADLMVAPF